MRKKRIRSRKGQIMGMPFIYLFALIVAALILAWGLKTVLKLGERGDAIQIADALKGLETDMKAYYMMEEGSETTIPLRLPKKVTYLCILESGPDGGYKGCKAKNKAGGYGGCPKFIEDEDDLGVFDQGIGNAYIFPLDAYKMTIFLLWKKNKEKIKLKCDGCSPLCYKNGQKVKLTAMGTHIELS